LHTDISLMSQVAGSSPPQHRCRRASGKLCSDFLQFIFSWFSRLRRLRDVQLLPCYAPS